MGLWVLFLGLSTFVRLRFVLGRIGLVLGFLLVGTSLSLVLESNGIVLVEIGFWLQQVLGRIGLVLGFILILVLGLRSVSGEIH